MIQAIFFDLDGTLVDTLPLYLRSYNRALQEQGFNLTDKEIVDTCFGKTEETICNKLGIPEKTAAFRNTYFEGVKASLREGKLFNGVMEFLGLAKEKGIKLGIISFAYNWYVIEMVKHLDIEQYFDIVIGHDDVTYAKPDPEAIMHACNKLNILPKNSIMIGDSQSDLLMGNSAGCKTVLFYPNGYELYYDLNILKESSPNLIISNFGELITVTSEVTVQNLS